MTDQHVRRRNSILATLAFEPGTTAPARVLRDELETTHGIAVTLARVQADLAWLADIGAIEQQAGLVRLTASGMEHVNGLRRLF